MNTQTVIDAEIVNNARHAMSGGVRVDATTEAGARAKLDQYLESARTRSESVISRIMTDVPVDALASGSALRFEAHTDGTGARVYVGQKDFSGHAIHDNALTQFADRASIPVAFIRHLQELRELSDDGRTMRPAGWARGLLAETLNQHARNALKSETLLLRAGKLGTDAQLRAVLSTKYKRIDCRPVLEGLLKTAQDAGALVTDAVASDVRASVRLILPRVYEVAPREFVVYGLSWTNSDYGKGPNAVSSFVLRLACLNGAMVARELRQIHLGSRLTADSIQYSARTIAADTRATMYAMQDTSRALLSAVKVDETIGLLKAAAEQKIDPKVHAAAFAKRHGKGLAEKVVNAFTSADVEELPPGNTTWRWSNAISWVAKQKDTDTDTRLDLERAAGDALIVAK